MSRDRLVSWTTDSLLDDDAVEGCLPVLNNYGCLFRNFEKEATRYTNDQPVELLMSRKMETACHSNRAKIRIFPSPWMPR